MVIDNILRQYPPLLRLGSKFNNILTGSSVTLNKSTSKAICEALKFSRDTSHGHLIGDYYQFSALRSLKLLETFNHCQSLGLDEVHLFGFDHVRAQATSANGKSHSDRVHHIEGFFEHSHSESVRSQYPFRKAAAVLFESISYAHTKHSLGWMQPYLAHNSILLFDHWHSNEYRHALGQKRALNEFLAANPYFTAKSLANFADHGKSFILQVETSHLTL